MVSMSLTKISHVNKHSNPTLENIIYTKSLIYIAALIYFVKIVNGYIYVGQVSCM